ncbi:MULTISPECIES: diacylglycerol kinase [Sulfurimonas]|uniref:Diacylglycerol kinase n=1 Tax=Sulfurimonas diazotrophicus TaxID=3131939 RepID=A0ABZ3HA35_9BACT
MNKPKYSLRRNFGYAVEGFMHVFRHETVFKIEVALFIVLSVVAWSIDVAKCERLWLQFSLFLPIVAELFNSAVERGVDLSTRDYHRLAKAAKDSAAAACLISVAMTVMIWGVVLL